MADFGSLWVILMTQTGLRVAVVLVVAGYISSGCSKSETQQAQEQVVITLADGGRTRIADAERPLKNIYFIAFSDSDPDDFVVIDGSSQIAFFDEYKFAFDLGEHGPGPCESDKPYVVSTHDNRAYVIDRSRLLEFDLADGSCVRERTASALRRVSGILQTDSTTFLHLPALPGQVDAPILFAIGEDTTLTAMAVTDMDAPGVEMPVPIRMRAPLRGHADALFFTPAFGTHMVRADLSTGSVSSFDLDLDLSADRTFEGIRESLDYINGEAERHTPYPDKSSARMMTASGFWP